MTGQGLVYLQALQTARAPTHLCRGSTPACRRCWSRGRCPPKRRRRQQKPCSGSTGAIQILPPAWICDLMPCTTRDQWCSCWLPSQSICKVASAVIHAPCSREQIATKLFMGINFYGGECLCCTLLGLLITIGQCCGTADLARNTARAVKCSPCNYRLLPRPGRRRPCGGP